MSKMADRSFVEGSAMLPVMSRRADKSVAESSAAVPVMSRIGDISVADGSAEADSRAELAGSGAVTPIPEAAVAFSLALVLWPDRLVAKALVSVGTGSRADSLTPSTPDGLTGALIVSVTCSTPVASGIVTAVAAVALAPPRAPDSVPLIPEAVSLSKPDAPPLTLATPEAAAEPSRLETPVASSSPDAPVRPEMDALGFSRGALVSAASDALMISKEALVAASSASPDALVSPSTPEPVALATEAVSLPLIAAADVPVFMRTPEIVAGALMREMLATPVSDDAPVSTPALTSKGALVAPTAALVSPPQDSSVALSRGAPVSTPAEPPAVSSRPPVSHTSSVAVSRGALAAPDSSEAPGASPAPIQVGTVAVSAAWSVAMISEASVPVAARAGIPG